MDIKQKLSSRKLWAAIVGVITGVAMIFGLDENIIGSVSGGIVSITSIVTYIITEGKIDQAAVKDAADKVQDAIESVQKEGDV